jgi:homoserine/homoserine lactone efflux protein
LLAASDTAFTVIKYFGAAYLIYMGIKLWRAPAFEFKDAAKEAISNKKLFAECFIFQLSNPKALVFFLSVFPQFIEHDRSYLGQFAVLVLTFCLLLVLVHSIYALFAHKAKSWFTSARGGRWVNRVGGTAFIGFGLLLANAKKTG